jgi:hypothetical protein
VPQLTDPSAEVSFYETQSFLIAALTVSGVVACCSLAAMCGLARARRRFWIEESEKSEKERSETVSIPVLFAPTTVDACADDARVDVKAEANDVNAEARTHSNHDDADTCIVAIVRGPADLAPPHRLQRLRLPPLPRVARPLVSWQLPGAVNADDLN